MEVITQASDALNQGDRVHVEVSGNATAFTSLVRTKLKDVRSIRRLTAQEVSDA